LQQTLLYKLSGAVFFVLFSLVRVLFGFYVSYQFWIDALTLLVQGRAHSMVVTVIYLLINVVMMWLQVYWYYLILTIALGLREEKADYQHKRESSSSADKAKSS